MSESRHPKFLRIREIIANKRRRGDKNSNQSCGERKRKIKKKKKDSKKISAQKNTYGNCKNIREKNWDKAELL